MEEFNKNSLEPQDLFHNLTLFKYFIIENEKINNEEELELKILKYLNNRYENIKIIKENINNKYIYFMNIHSHDIPNINEIIYYSNNRVERTGVFGKEEFDRWLPWLMSSPYIYEFHSYIFDLVEINDILDKINKGGNLNQLDELILTLK